MKSKSIFVSGFAATLISLSPSIHAQQSEEVIEAPRFEEYMTIQRLDPVGGIIFADGKPYHLQSETQVWIDDKLAPRDELATDMIGLRVGLSAHEHEGRNIVTRIHVMKSDGRGRPTVGDQR